MLRAWLAWILLVVAYWHCLLEGWSFVRMKAVIVLLNDEVSMSPNVNGFDERKG